jgi:hypothetical protein
MTILLFVSARAKDRALRADAEEGERRLRGQARDFGDGRQSRHVADEELGMLIEHSIGKQVAEFGLRPAAHEKRRDEMQVGARTDVVRNAGRQDGEDTGGTLGSLVEPREEPVPSPEDEPAQLAFAAIVRELDVAVVEEE